MLKFEGFENKWEIMYLKNHWKNSISLDETLK